MTLSRRSTYLFGGDKPWLAEDWVASDDRVRGGRSQSYLVDDTSGTEEEEEATVRFHGELDVAALGGAGFASKRSGDGKRYTLVVKDEVLPTRPDGREQSSVSWEYHFAGHATAELDIPWGDLTPTYRGKAKPDAKPLDLARIKRQALPSSFATGRQGFVYTKLVLMKHSPTPKSPSSSGLERYHDYPLIETHLR
ncbi:hypothetical protein CIB48_g3798 [Xylaria polymorpha]|nr:hypothetical protein CIB48_g3798 [Xylaria polymorpha]